MEILCCRLKTNFFILSSYFKQKRSEQSEIIFTEIIIFDWNLKRYVLNQVKNYWSLDDIIVMLIEPATHHQFVNVFSSSDFPATG